MGWNDPPDKGDWLLGLMVFVVVVSAVILWKPGL